MSFTATGFEVTSSGGSLGGLIRSLMFWTKDVYQGASTSFTSRRSRWSSGLYARGLFTRAAILLHQPSLFEEPLSVNHWTITAVMLLQLLEKPNPANSAPYYHRIQ